MGGGGRGFACNLYKAPVIPAWQPEVSSEMLSFWVSCASLHRLPGSLAPARLSSLIANPCTTLPLICFFSPLQLCMQLIPSWLIPPNPLSISNVKFYKLLPPITPHTGQAVRGSCLCAHKMLIPSLVMVCFLVRHPL